MPKRRRFKTSTGGSAFTSRQLAQLEMLLGSTKHGTSVTTAESSIQKDTNGGEHYVPSRMFAPGQEIQSTIQEHQLQNEGDKHDGSLQSLSYTGNSLGLRQTVGHSMEARQGPSSSHSATVADSPEDSSMYSPLTVSDFYSTTLFLSPAHRTCLLGRCGVSRSVFVTWKLLSF